MRRGVFLPRVAPPVGLEPTTPRFPVLACQLRYGGVWRTIASGTSTHKGTSRLFRAANAQKGEYYETRFRGWSR